jgi:undecaprenyl-diphosphatase
MTVTAVLATGEQYLGDAGDFLLINRFARRTGWLHGFMTFYAETLGLVVCAVLLALGWWVARRARDPRAMASLVWAGVGTLVAVGINQPIVSAVHERRPYQSIPHMLLLVSRSSDYGFPSDHATMAGAVAAGLCFVNRRLGIAAWVAALLLAFARVYVGAHYPHDVIAGLLLGAAVIVVGRPLAVPLLAALIRRLSTTPLRPVLTAAPEHAAVVAGRRDGRAVDVASAEGPQ